jgi:DNA replication licensing factor MCM7
VRRSTTTSRKVCVRHRKHSIPAKQRIAAFADFLKNFKSSSTEAADQLEGLNLNGNGAEEEYDMVDDSGDPVPNGARTGNGKSKIKYLNQLQEVSNRERDEIVIDLNDVELVSGTWIS